MFTDEFKRDIVAEIKAGHRLRTDVIAEHRLPESVVGRWQRDPRYNAPAAAPTE